MQNRPNVQSRTSDRPGAPSGGKAHLSTIMAHTPHTHPRIQIIQAFFDRLGQKYVLPDVDFLLSVHDGFSGELGVPVFSFAKRATSQSILIPDFEALFHANDLIRSCGDASRAHPWHTKQNIIFWRGSTTGGEYRLDNYFDFPRAKLVFLSAENPTWLDAAFTNFCQGSPEVFVLIEQNGRPLAPFLSMADHFAYKYLIDIDGNSCTYSRCRWILLSNSTLIKPTSPNIQWYYKALVPWVHYIPVKEDLSDLSNVFVWLIAHDNQAQMIAEQGQQLGRVIFSEEAIDHYMLLLLRAYKKLQK